MRRFALVMLLPLAACQTPDWRTDPASPFYSVPVGAVLELRQELTVPAQRVGVYLQAGALREYSGVNPYHPYCALDLRRRLDTPQTVRADRFTVVRSTQEIVQTVRLPGVRLADDGDPGFEIYATVMELRSERQREVQRLTCGHWVYPPAQRYLTLAEIRQALGGLFALELPEKTN